VPKKQNSSLKQISDSKSSIADYGIRKISSQNFSKIIALPKTALINCGNPRKVNVKLVEINGKKCIMLTPVPKTSEEEIEDKMLGANTL
jgi:hypothetical protein